MPVYRRTRSLIFFRIGAGFIREVEHHVAQVGKLLGHGPGIANQFDSGLCGVVVRLGLGGDVHVELLHDWLVNGHRGATRLGLEKYFPSIKSFFVQVPDVSTCAKHKLESTCSGCSCSRILCTARA